MLTVHGIKTCDTCRKAMKALADGDLPAQFRDIRATPVAAEELSKWWAALGSSLLNTRSTTWRVLSEADRQQDPQALLLAHPTLIKRPVIETEDDTLHLGWTPATRAALGLVT